MIQQAASQPFAGAISFDAQADSATASWSTAGRGDSYAFGADPPSHANTLVLQYSPFQLEFRVDGVAVMRVNSEGLMHFEQFRGRNPRPTQPQPPNAPVPVEGETPEQAAEAQARFQEQMQKHAADQQAFDANPSSVMPYDEAGMWEESHGSHTDHKSKGPAALGLDVTFVNVKHAYGIPEHASSFSLKNTLSVSGSDPAHYSEPYRLYNLDVFEYELDEPMALYGAVPYITAHTVDGKFTSGVMWLNAAETYVDLTQHSGAGGLFGAATVPRKTVHWMSETGVMDLYFVLGPRPSDVMHQYTSLTGFPYLPPQFSIGYHQCRWNYKSSDDVLGVDAGFDEHDMPFDVIWLDIEHTDAKKYFTWSQHTTANASSARARERALLSHSHSLTAASVCAVGIAHRSLTPWTCRRS